MYPCLGTILKNNLIYLFIYLLTVLGLHSCTGFPPVAMSGGSYIVGVLGLLVAVASLVAEHGL